MVLEWQWHFMVQTPDSWSEELENIGPVFLTITILFGVDTLSALTNSICLCKILNMNVLSEFSQVLRKYGHLIAIFGAANAVHYFASKDINLGLDHTMSFQWASKEGWIKLLNNSIDLTHEEKTELLAKSNF